jgi:hypothetical protein
MLAVITKGFLGQHFAPAFDHAGSCQDMRFVQDKTPISDSFPGL